MQLTHYQPPNIVRFESRVLSVLNAPNGVVIFDFLHNDWNYRDVVDGLLFWSSANYEVWMANDRYNTQIEPLVFLISDQISVKNYGMPRVCPDTRIKARTVWGYVRICSSEKVYCLEFYRFRWIFWILCFPHRYCYGGLRTNGDRINAECVCIGYSFSGSIFFYSGFMFVVGTLLLSSYPLYLLGCKLLNTIYVANVWVLTLSFSYL